MKMVIKDIILFIVIILLSSCGKKSYVVFDYNCNGKEYHKCELKNNKLNCNIEIPTCGEYNFTGWYRANEYKNQVNLNGTFTLNEIIYARWEENGQIIESSSQELVSTIIKPGEIDTPSSSKIEYSSQIIEEPSSQNPTPVPDETYIILFNANGGSGGQSQSISGVKYGNDLPTINQTKPTKTGYTFTGWYDSQTGGTQYYNSSNSPVKKYDKKSNITLYAQWRVNVLTIQYNGNGGTWISTNSRFGVNSSGTVIEKSTGKIYSKEINYGTNTESSGLTDYNGSWFKWKRDGYTVESKKEYYLKNGSITNTLDQTKVYSAADLAKYSGCDLSKSDCIITVKVNWKESTGLGSNIKLSDEAKKACSYVLNSDDLKIRLYRCPCKQYHSDGTYSEYNCMYTKALPGGGTDITMPGMGRGDLPYETQIAKETINFTRYQMGAFTFEQPGSIEQSSTYEFAKSFMILFKGDFLEDYRFKFNDAGEVIFPTGTCTQGYSERTLVSIYDSGKYKQIIDDIYDATKYFILVNDDGKLTSTEYAGYKPNGPTFVMVRWSKSGMNFIDILKKMRTSDESAGFKYYRKSNVYDCRNLLTNNS